MIFLVGCMISLGCLAIAGGLADIKKEIAYHNSLLQELVQLLKETRGP
jgi:hypothetical protein